MKKRTLKNLNIKSVEHLALQLGCHLENLLKVSNNISKYYRSGDRLIKGKIRHIDEPISELRRIVDRLQNILSRIELPNFLHGGRKGCSIITNAQVHIGRAAVLNFDIQDFFPSIHYPRVYKVFITLGCSPDVASILTRLTTYEGCVPHGSPTSISVANLCIIPLAKRIKNLAEKHNSRFTQFVDDGVMSGPAYIENLRKLIDKIIKQEGFAASPKPHKRQTRYRHQEQLVTGVKVNYRIDVSSETYNNLNNEIQRIKSETNKGLVPDKKTIASVSGKISHVKILNLEKGNKLQHQFELLHRG
jgi:RNA-directed DNA polymerase